MKKSELELTESQKNNLEKIINQLLKIAIKLKKLGWKLIDETYMIEKGELIRDAGAGVRRNANRLSHYRSTIEAWEPTVLDKTTGRKPEPKPTTPKKKEKLIKYVNPECRTGMRAQTILFDRSKWTVAKAKKWLRDHGYKTPKVDTKPGYHHFRQEPTSHFKRNSFRTKAFGKNTGIKTVLGCPLKKWA